MKLVIDIEANGLENPTKIWCIVCKDIDTKEIFIYRNVVDDAEERAKFLSSASKCSLWIGHNFLGYDYPVLNKLIGFDVKDVHEHSIDTLIISKLVEYSRPQGHSIEAYGEELGYPKGKNHYLDFFKKWSQELEDYCVRDVEITHRVYDLYSGVIVDPAWKSSIELEQRFQLIVNDLHTNGFYFNSTRAESLLGRIQAELDKLDEQLDTFPLKRTVIREFTPRLTKFGTISKSSIPRSVVHLIADFQVGRTYQLLKYEKFNPSSHKQLVDILHEAGWQPVDKTSTHIETERELKRLQRQKGQVDTTALTAKLKILEKYGWKINENNLATLPNTAPSPARTLAKRILLEARRRTLTEWLGLVHPDTNRIHGKFYGIGAWTHRMAHQNPNTANIPTEAKLFGKEMRSLWCAPKNKLIVGVDAEGIQLRIFAHYIDDKEFTDALVRGRKEDKTDPHSLNQRILGSVCKSRTVAKRFIYALLLGAGIGKLSEILECSQEEAREALRRILERYTGFAYLKQTVIPKDGERGYFIGLDGRRVSIPGTSADYRSHLCMSGYLQNGEAIVMKKACILWDDLLNNKKIVNFVHDEWQTEVNNDMQLALHVAKTQAESLRLVGEELGLRCPLAGSYWNDDHKDYTIGTNWYQTH